MASLIAHLQKVEAAARWGSEWRVQMPNTPLLPSAASEQSTVASAARQTVSAPELRDTDRSEDRYPPWRQQPSVRPGSRAAMRSTPSSDSQLAGERPSSGRTHPVAPMPTSRRRAGSRARARPLLVFVEGYTRSSIHFFAIASE